MLTAYAAEGYRILAKLQQDALENVAYKPFADQLAELGIAYVSFSQDYQRRFLMMFQSHEVDLSDPEYQQNSGKAFQPLRECVRGYFAGQPDGESRARAVMFSAWSLVHGTACLNQGPRLEAYFSAEQVPSLVKQMCYDFARANLPPR